MKEVNFKRGLSRLFLSLILLTTLVFHSVGQTRISGKVVSADDGAGLPGATVQIKGESTGTITDIEGNFSLEASPEDILVISFVGFTTQEITVGTQTFINVNLGFDVVSMEEVVVVGYGTQREKDLTSAITTIKTDAILKTPTSQAMQALQGRVPGVQIVSSGAPGSGPTVRVRGVGTLEGESRPLYVVDGMFLDNIDFLNPADIESISVLKDASAAAIYGVKAANGVILIETKKGSYGQEGTLTYDGYWGVQRPQNVLEMANAEQFINYALATGSTAEAAFIDNAFQRYGRSRDNPDLPAVDTDWYDEVMEPWAAIQSHTITASGGTGDARYSISAGYLNQDGIIKEVKNSYERYNFRAKMDVNVRDWVNIGGNLNVTRSEQHVASQSIWFNTYFAVPIIPVYDETNVDAFPVKLANAQNIGYRGRQNPYFNMLYSDDRNLVGRMLGNFFVDVDLIPDKISFKTTYNYTYNSLNARNIDFRFNDGVRIHSPGLYKANETTFDQIWDNVLTYNQSFGDHSVTAMAGYSVRTESFSKVRLDTDTLIVDPSFDNEELWYINDPGKEINTLNSGDDGRSFNGASYFGRLAYNYNDRYLVYGTLRRDGTNKFQKKWGLFPTVGIGWVVTEESFFNYEFVDFLKLRASWGKLGNANVSAAIGQPTYDSQNLAIDDQLENGLTVTKQFSYLDRWETTVETNIGITSTLLDGRLSLEADYYIRDTEDAALTVILPLVRATVRRNVGSFRNQGIELSANWSDEFSDDLQYFVGINFATLKNEVLELGGQQYLDAGMAEFRQRSIIGSPLEAFFGYEVEGIYQNTSEITNSGLTDEFINDFSLEPGDFKYKDQNNDGVIDDLDRVVLGSYLPELTYGFNLGASYKQFELTADFQGQAGHKILNRKRGEIIFTTDPNLDAELVKNLWDGEGSSNKYPSAAGLRKGYNQAMSDYFVESGTYFRIQNVRFTYLLGESSFFGSQMPDVRVTLTAERPVTLFKYNGFNPEVANGIDRQTYPIPAVYTIGINIKL